MEKFLNLIFIPACVFCKTQGTFFCDACLLKCKKLPLRFVEPINSFSKHLYFYEYEGLIRQCIRESKYKNRYFASLKTLSDRTFTLPFVKSLLLNFSANDDCLVLPIPVSRAKLKKRGFNQAEIIAQKLSKALDIPYKTNVLVRAKETTAQYTNNRTERYKNLQNAFELKSKERVKNKKVILVDDVCTSGATFFEATNAVHAAGVNDVLCVALAWKSLKN